MTEDNWSPQFDHVYSLGLLPCPIKQARFFSLVGILYKAANIEHTDKLPCISYAEIVEMHAITLFRSGYEPRSFDFQFISSYLETMILLEEHSIAQSS